MSDDGRGRRPSSLGDAGLGQTLLVVPRAADIPSELTRLPRWRVREGALSPLGAGEVAP